MLRYVATALLVLAGVVVLRWWRHRTDALGRRQPFPVVSVALCVVLAGASAWPVAVDALTERRLSAVGSQVAGVPMEVHCQSFGEASVEVSSHLGEVAYGPDGRPGRRAVLAWGQCRLLRTWAGDRGHDASLEQVVAVHVLTHEAVHVAGHTDEARTECLAVQRDAATARLLGADDDVARALAVRYWHEVYPRVRPGYRSAACGPGGAMDEGSPDAPWRP